jgi:hypothetical protein
MTKRKYHVYIYIPFCSLFNANSENVYVLKARISYLGDIKDFVSECELGRVNGKNLKVQLFAEWKVG